MNTALPQDAVVPDCWNHLGVWGESTCPRLVQVTHCRNCETFSRAGRQLFQRPASADYLESWAETLAQDKTGVEEATFSVAVFRLAAEWLALPTRCLQEVVEPRVVRSLPHRSTAILRGLVNLRGEIVLCVALQELLGVDAVAPENRPATASRSRMVVIEKGRDRFVFPVDEMGGIVHISPAAVSPAPATVARDRHAYTRGLFPWGGKPTGLLDDELVFAALAGRVLTGRDNRGGEPEGGEG
jgi:chemotaxis-related protein WspD